MPGRNAFVIVTTLGFFLIPVSFASAHKLEAQARVEPGQKIRVEAWFDSDDPASGAKVQVFREDKSLLVEGKMNDDGVFQFSFPTMEPLEIVVNAGQGHGAKLNLSKQDLQNPSSETGPIRQAKPSKENADPSDIRSLPTFPWRDVILGITFLLALASFVISLRNARALKTPEKTP